MAAYWRIGRQRSTGAWLQGRMGSDGPFGVPLARHAQNVADAHGLPVEDVEVVEGRVGLDPEPDLTTARPPQPVAPNPDDVRQARRQAALADLAALDADDPTALRQPDTLAKVVRALQAMKG